MSTPENPNQYDLSVEEESMAMQELADTEAHILRIQEQVHHTLTYDYEYDVDTIRSEVSDDHREGIDTCMQAVAYGVLFADLSRKHIDIDPSATEKIYEAAISARLAIDFEETLSPHEKGVFRGLLNDLIELPPLEEKEQAVIFSRVARTHPSWQKDN